MVVYLSSRTATQEMAPDRVVTHASALCAHFAALQMTETGIEAFWFGRVGSEEASIELHGL